MILYDSDSDNELEIVAVAVIEAESSSRTRPRSNKRRTSIQRYNLGHQGPFLDYFADPLVFPPNTIRRRFRMKRYLFLRIHSAVQAQEPYFVRSTSNGLLQ